MLRKLTFILSLIFVSVINIESVSAQFQITEVKVGEAINDLDWSEANQLLAVAADNGVYIYTIDLQPVTYFPAHGISGVLNLAWKPDGSQLVTVGVADVNALVWDYDRVTHQFTQANLSSGIQTGI